MEAIPVADRENETILLNEGEEEEEDRTSPLLTEEAKPASQPASQLVMCELFIVK